MKTGDGTHFVHIQRSSVPNPYTGPGGISGQLGAGTHYFEVGGMNDGVSAVMLRWMDATTAGTFTLETTNLPVSLAAHNSTTASEWSTEPVVITSPSGAAAGCTMVHFGNNGVKRNRIKFVASATSNIEIWPHGIH